ncbi:MAG: SWIM zinc finger family protein [Halobacteriota archaeon]
MDAVDWHVELVREGRLTPEITDAVLDAHGGRGRRAMQAVAEGRVKRYRDFTVVVGRSDEYVVEDGSCTCRDYRYNLGGEGKCQHVLAVEIAEAVDEVDEHDMWYGEVRDFLDG